MLTTDWPKMYDAPMTILKGGMVTSGMYELAPVRLSARSKYVNFTDAMVDALSSIRRINLLNCPIIVSYGDQESPEFQRQTRDFAAALDAYTRLCGRGGEAPFQELVRSAGLGTDILLGGNPELLAAVNEALRGMIKNGDWAKEHPEWLYWIRRSVPDRPSGSHAEDLYGNPIFTPEELKVIKGQDPLHILGDGSQVRHYTYGGDLAKGIRVAMESPKAVNEDFNISTATSTTAGVSPGLYTAIRSKVVASTRPSAKNHAPAGLGAAGVTSTVTVPSVPRRVWIWSTTSRPLRAAIVVDTVAGSSAATRRDSTPRPPWIGKIAKTGPVLTLLLLVWRPGTALSR